MTKALRLLGFLAALLAAVPAVAQSPRSYAQAELDQMLAPVALYPDALLSQVLMAATYPLEVVQAARWKRANTRLEGEDAVRAVQNEDWDPSVKSLVAFPQILERMDEKLEWTQSLGDAFLAQEPQVMATVQQLRQRAHAAGNLQSNQQIHVQQQGQVILVQPASPQYVYVPYYDPLVVYGPWWWSAYPPVVWAPWPGYARAYAPGVSVGFWWGRPVGLSVNFFYGNFDWHQHHVRVVHTNTYYYRPPVVVNRTVVVERGRWQHDPHHRRGQEYRHDEVRQRYVSAQPERRDVKREDRRPEQQAAPAPRPAQVQQQAAPATRPQADRRDDKRDERRDNKRDDRRVEQRPAPGATPAQPAQPTVQQRAEQSRPEQRDNRRAERQAAGNAQRQAQETQRQEQQAKQQAQRQAQENQRQAQRQAQENQRQAQRQAQESQRQAQEAKQQAEQAQRQAQENQRQAQRQEQRETKREKGRDPRDEKG